jgi:hypothetical protein
MAWPEVAYTFGMPAAVTIADLNPYFHLSVPKVYVSFDSHVAMPNSDSAWLGKRASIGFGSEDLGLIPPVHLVWIRYFQKSALWAFWWAIAHYHPVTVAFPSCVVDLLAVTRF